mgnify:CR=1 FL=1
MADPCVLGVDLGGTAIKLGLFSLQGELLSEHQRPTPQPATPGSVCVEIVDAINFLDPDGRAAVVGIGLPGPMDAEARVARICINLPGWEEVPLAAWLEPRLKRSVTLANDGNCALVGEAWKGAAAGCSDVLLLTLGTGVGGGVMVGGQLFTGHNGAAAEPGLITLFPDGPDCNSGNRGSLEQFASISGLKRLSGVEPSSLAMAASCGDAKLWPIGSDMANCWEPGSARSSICSLLSWCWSGEVLPAPVNISFLPCVERSAPVCRR